MVFVDGKQFGYARRKPLNLPTKPASRQVTKGRVPLFLFDRRMQGDEDTGHEDDAVGQDFEDVAEGNSKR